MEENTNQPKKLILVAEDDHSYQNILKTKISNSGYRVVIGIDGQDALNKAKEEKPDLVLLDMIMPNMNGFEFLKAIREDENLKDLKIIIVSNLGFKGEIEKAKELGVEDYWIKSEISIHKLLDLISEKLKEEG